MRYREVLPVDALRPYVKCLWVLQGEFVSLDASPDRILPDGSAEIVIHRAAPMIAHGLNVEPRTQSTVMIVGQLSRHILLQPTGDVDIVGVRFTPNGLYKLLGIPASELTDRSIEVTQYRAAFARDLIAAAHAPGDCIARLQHVLLNRLPRKGESRDFVFAAIDRILKSNGALPIGDLCRELAISGRQLERRFDREVGLRPKQFARVIRFSSVARHAHLAGATSGARLAHAFGFADQAHLIREFRHFAGICPSEHFKADPGLAAVFSTGRDVAFIQD